MKPILTGLLAFIFSWLIAGYSFATPTASDKETARNLMDQGDQLFAAAKYTEALDRYRAAHQIMNVPTTGVEVAKTEAQLGQLVEARGSALAVTRLPVAGPEPGAFTRARADAAALAEKLSTRIPTLLIEVELAPANTASPNTASPNTTSPNTTSPNTTSQNAASLNTVPSNTVVQVNDATIPAAALGLPYSVNPGSYRVSASADGYLEATQQLQLAEGERKSVRLSLEPTEMAAAEPAVPSTTAAESSTESTPGVAITDEQIADAPQSETDTVAYVALGVAGVGLTVGALSGLASLSAKEDAEEFCIDSTCSAAAQEDIDSSKSLATVADVSFAVGLVAGVYGIWRLLSSGSDDAAAVHSLTSPLLVSVAPQPDFDGATVGIRGDF